MLFVVLFAALISGLIVLWRVDQSQDGFTPTISSNHYAWTYGPTAVLVIVLSLWRQLDYHCKTLQPWAELRKNQADAKRSVMLDYVAPLNITSLLKALRVRHWPVAASIAGFALMKLIILFSTGLLILTPTTLENEFPITVTSTFNGSQFWETVPTNSDGTYRLFLTRDIGAYDNISSQPLAANLGLLAREKASNGSLPTLDTTAFQSYELPLNSSAQSVWADLDVFYPNITCELAEAKLNISDTWGVALANYELQSDTCSVGTEGKVPISFFELGPDTCYNDCPPSELLYGLWKVNCSEVANEGNLDPWNNLTATLQWDIRHALLVTNTSFENITKPGTSNETTVRVIPETTSAVICKTDYYVSKARVVKDMATGAYSIDQPTTGQHLSNLTAIMLSELIYTAAYYTEGIVMEGQTGLDSRLSSNARDPIFYTIIESQSGEQSLKGLLSPQSLQQAAIKAYSGIASQFMKENYLVPTRETSNARGEYIQDRLHVGEASLWIMIAGFCAMMVLTLCIMLTATRDAVPHDPGTIANNAFILSNSPELQEVLQSAGSIRTSQLRALLSDWRFTTSKNGTFGIYTSRAYRSSAKSSAGNKSKKGAWIPLAASYPVICLTFAAPVVVLVVLEVLYSVSERNQGIADITGHEDRTQYLSRYLSALIMLLVATCFNALDFTIASFAPFSLLRSGNTSARRGLNLNLLGELPPVALVRSLTVRHFASAFSNVAGMIGSVLTIIASGLWILERNIATEQTVTASSVDAFNITWFNSSSAGDAGAGVLLDKVQHGSATMPTTIWSDFAIPTISDVQKVLDGQVSPLSGSASQNFTLNVDALRPELSCEIVGDEHVHVDYFLGDQGQSLIGIYASAPLQPGCQRGGPNGTSSFMDFSMVTQPPGGDFVTWVGQSSDLHLGPYSYSNRDSRNDTGDFSEGYPVNENQADNPAGCPSIGVIFGQTKENETTLDDVTVLMCSQKVQQVPLKVTYTGERTMNPAINTNIEPVPDFSSAKYLTNGTEGIDTFPYRVQTYFGTLITYTGNLTTFNENDQQQVLDVFFNQLVYGPNGTALEDLAGRSNRGNLTKAVQVLYNKYMSLVIDMKFRHSVPATTDNPVHGTVRNFTTRLQVNGTSKLILQILLGTMTAFGMLAFWLTDLRGTLPRDPCSIASTMAFLAGSELCSGDKHLLRLQSGASQQDIAKALEGWVFSLGWWTIDSTGNARSDGDGELEKVQRRFGIDVGVPAQLGFRETRWWRLRRRLGWKAG
ncbi:hypothetical protein HII31_10749 [Pseudocercospora fuligena]|uniref:Uncharacterized protein n=1 Tax=Pseudocercospora fuligena TaxID=685502 RepID=A0A8H6RBE4_9PEZI|nr:hypothetical protein HII31_10749 [Pseudocercospora fuligena]